MHPIKITSQPEITSDFSAIHPDPLIAREVVIDELAGRLYETRAALARALDYKAGTPEGLAIKRDIRSALSRTERSRMGDIS